MSSSARIHSLLIRRIPPLLPSSQNSTLTGLAQRSSTRCLTIAAGPTTALPHPSLFRRALGQTFSFLAFATLGFAMAAAPAYATISAYATPLTDEETLGMWVPSDATEQAHDDHLAAHPLVQSLRANPAFSESRPHLKIPPAWRAQNLTAGILMGAERVPFPPLVWLDATGEKKELVQISYVGAELCGHPGIVHGGYLATALDEGLARCAFAALPHRIGLTANLNVNYKAPCAAGQYIVLRGELTKHEGRKAWVEGRIETLPAGDEKPVVLAEATALYVEPKQAAALSNYYSAT